MSHKAKSSIRTEPIPRKRLQTWIKILLHWVALIWTISWTPLNIRYLEGTFQLGGWVTRLLLCIDCCSFEWMYKFAHRTQGNLSWSSPQLKMQELQQLDAGTWNGTMLRVLQGRIRQQWTWTYIPKYGYQGLMPVTPNWLVVLTQLRK
jgi:hypothetical protein